MQYNRLYVDEIQDYNQAQLALFFTLCKERNLFLAGDNAQSVEEGVDFRFEDLRQVAHSLYEGDRRYIPEKPLKVNKNFRSHQGILSVAAAVLERLLAAFPQSANKLAPDHGLFMGPRPGILQVTMDGTMDSLRSLLKRNPRLMVLAHDERVVDLKAQIEISHPIIGIRDSKGLEFRSVVIVNFFSDLSDSHQKAWRELLRGRDISFIKPGFPQLEGHLKLLYTAITRCSRRLFFLETRQSIAGRAFFRWLAQTKGLAEFQDASKMETAMTPDEWRCFGVDMAVNAEEEERPTKALEWLDQAIFAFQQVDDESLLRKAFAHRSSLLIRKELDEQYDRFEATDENEENVANAAYACSREGVLPELYRLLDTVLPKLNSITRDGLEKDILSKLKEYSES